MQLILPVEWLMSCSVKILDPEENKRVSACGVLCFYENDSPGLPMASLVSVRHGSAVCESDPIGFTV